MKVSSGLTFLFICLVSCSFSFAEEGGTATDLKVEEDEVPIDEATISNPFKEEESSGAPLETSSSSGKQSDETPQDKGENSHATDAQQAESKPVDSNEQVANEAIAQEDASTDTASTESTEQVHEAAIDPARKGPSEFTQEASQQEQTEDARPAQSGPFIDLFGETLLSLDMIDDTHAQLREIYTNEALGDKAVVGVYFSADWCGPCRKFTPELVAFYEKMNARRGRKDKFEIVWVSRCRDFEAFGQFFTHMKWLALPPQEAMGQRGQMLSDKFKVKGIPTLVLLDEAGNVITTDARNKIPADKAGIGFPWKNPLVQLYTVLFPRSLRFMLKSQVTMVKESIMRVISTVLKAKPAQTAA